MVSKVTVIIPPIMGAAIRRTISAPAYSLIRARSVATNRD